MGPRIVTFLLAAALAAFGLAGSALAASRSDAEGVIARDEDFGVLAVVDDDDADGDADGDGLAGTNSGTGSFTSGVDSNDGTNSRVTPVSRDRDLSGGDLTRDRTKDGPGASTRDWTRNHTNDRSRNDTR
jgi:hypothetical protein